MSDGIPLTIDGVSIEARPEDRLLQAAAGRPLTRTVQTRQLPQGLSPFIQHRRGM